MSAGELRSKGAALFYVVAALATGVSIDTSWRFFEVRLDIPNMLFGRPPLLGFIGERFVLFAVLELTMVACGVAMRANARRPDGKQGATQILAWALCALSGYMAVDLAGAVEGFARVVLGPVLGLIALHLALGIEVKVRRAVNAGTWSRIVAEFRERFLSRLGLGNDGRKAAERSRDRARDRAARLATAAGRGLWRKARLVRAVRASGATLDPAQRARLREQVIVLKSIDDLGKVDGVESPWTDVVPAHVQRLADDAKQVGEAIREASEQHAAAIIAEAQQTASVLRREVDEALREARQRSASVTADADAILRATRGEADTIRAAAEEFRRDREAAAQQQYEQLTAAARADASAIRSGAQSGAEALRSAADRSASQRLGAVGPKRSEAPRETRRPASAEALIEALDEEFPDSIPSTRDAEACLRRRFGGASATRVGNAIAALREARGHVNGHQPDLVNT